MSMRQRIARARLLADRYPAAAEILTFYAKLTEYQQALLDRLPADAVDHEQLVAAVPAFLGWLEREAPAALAQSAVDLRRLSGVDWRQRLGAAFAEVSGEPSQAEYAARFVVEALLQPFFARAARASAEPHSEPSQSRQAEGRCPSCGGFPVVGVLREEGHGARRALVCARCATEWAYRRVACPGCGEREFDALPVYTAAPFEHIRVEACDRCRRYLKTVDLSKDGLAIPLVDDLASLSLDLWARAEGYVRLRDNLLRT